MSVFRLRCGVQHYAWGSPSLMPERFGWEDTGEPFAELWIGDHPSLPSAVLVDETWISLPNALASDPHRWLGPETVDAYGARLPMLLKILGIGEPLSLQAHPSMEQARHGFAREDALGIDRSAPNRSYRDDRAKPEMICALTTMEALCGFRDLDESRELFGLVGGPLRSFVKRLDRDEELPNVVGELLSLDRHDQRGVVASIADAVAVLPWPVAAVVGQLADRYPDDAGVAVGLLLNVVSLEPGDALYLPAGNMHAYLSGLGVEVMANSDNVLRGGLTPKHVDVSELVSTLVPLSGPWPFTRPESDPQHPGVAFFRSPSPEVGLAELSLSGSDVVVPGSDGPTLLVVTEGSIGLSSREIDPGSRTRRGGLRAAGVARDSRWSRRALGVAGRIDETVAVTPEEFRAAGHRLIDWIADERSAVRLRRVLPAVSPGDVRSLLPEQPPTTVDSSIDALLGDLERIVVPGMTNVQHPRHFGWFPSNASLSSVLGDIASSGLGGLGISWESNPSLTEVEEVMCDWMRQLCGLSPAWSGTIHDTASTAVLVALLSARERATDNSFVAGGLQAHDRPIVVYATAQAHSSIAKAAVLAGFGQDNLRLVATDPITYAMDPLALAEALEVDLAAGKRPTIVVASLGSTGVTAFDPLPAIADLCAAHGVWLHVDAAMSGSALLLPECRPLFDGVERADSLSWNPHKWMGTILDCSLYYVRDVESLVRVMSTNPSYLRSTTTEREATQYRDWGIPLGRRFRALKLWFHLRLDGVEAIQTRLRRDLRNAEWFAEQVRATPRWLVVAPVTLQTVCVRYEPAGMSGDDLDAFTLAWIRRINASGDAFCSPSQLDGRWMVRVSIGVEETERSDVEFLWERFRSEVAALERTAAED